MLAQTELLNDVQRKAVETTDGPVLIFAGAGSGKTRVLTHRIAYLLEQKKVFPDRILAVTFTNKAAGEMKARLERMVGAAARDLWVGTFHSMCVRMLRRDGRKIGISPNFAIMDDADQRAIVREVVADREYDRRLAESNGLDFDDLNANAIKLLDNDEDARTRYQTKFKYVLVDEYQDVNYAQYRLVATLAKEHGNITVVGDDDQSIYAWRGSDYRMILRFEEDFPGAKVFK